MSRSIRILGKARADIVQILNWLDRRSPQGAANWYIVLVATIDKLVSKPEGYPILAEASPRWNRRIHQALFKTSRGKNYRIVFEWTDVEVQILRVRSPYQRPLRRRDLPRP